MATDSTIAAALPITVNQCNNSANLNGSVVICRVRVRTVIRASIADTAYSANTATFTALPTTPADGLAAPLQVVVPEIVVVPLVTTPPETTAGESSSFSDSSSTSSRDRLARTGSLAKTGTVDPAPMGLLGAGLLLAGAVALLAMRRSAASRA